MPSTDQNPCRTIADHRAVASDSDPNDGVYVPAGQAGAMHHSPASFQAAGHTSGMGLSQDLVDDISHLTAPPSWSALTYGHRL